MANTWTTIRSLHSGFKRSGADLVTTITSTKDYNSKYGLKFSTKSHILTHIINKNTAFTIFISFIHDGKKKHVKYHGVILLVGM